MLFWAAGSLEALKSHFIFLLVSFWQKYRLLHLNHLQKVYLCFFSLALLLQLALLLAFILTPKGLIFFIQVSFLRILTRVFFLKLFLLSFS
jgi:hypothetical protein